MFESNKVKRMTVVVVGVLDNDYKSNELMQEVVRRNCKIDSRLAGHMVYRIRSYDDEKQKRCDYNVEFEAYDMGGIVRDFELLKKADVIKKVEKKQDTIYIVY